MNAQVGQLGMRLSGLALSVLVAGTLISTTMMDEGIARLGYAYLAGRWSNVGWQLWDLLLLWLALLHGGHGVRQILLARLRTPASRLWGVAALLTVVGVALALGTLVIFTFDPAAV